VDVDVFHMNPLLITTLVDYKKCPKGWERLDDFRTFDWKKFSFLSIFNAKYLNPKVL